ncbi:hypothetical protein GE09DRAFT_1263735 [Coniochaeta sp. 2T2.1]|nr:hypothetical protein GE09DRAFT_1263735 [Coniochaeta sp. 2T2.1]
MYIYAILPLLVTAAKSGHPQIHLLPDTASQVTPSLLPQSKHTKTETKPSMIASTVNRQPNPPSDPYTTHSNTPTPGEAPAITTSNGAPRPPSPTSKWLRTIDSPTTRQFNSNLLRAACSLAYHGFDLPATTMPVNVKDPLHPLLQALHKAEEMLNFAVAKGRYDLAAKAQLFKGHAYRAMGIWDLAYEAYVRAASDPDFAGDTSARGLEAETMFCAEMRYRALRLHVRDIVVDHDVERGGFVRGLFRCGTFGPVERQVEGDDGGAGEHPVVGEDIEQQQRKLEEEIWLDLGLTGDASESEGVWESGGEEGGEGGGDGQEDDDDEDSSEIDWLAIGSPQSSVYERPPRPQPYPRLKRPLRSVRGQSIPRRKLGS